MFLAPAIYQQLLLLLGGVEQVTTETSPVVIDLSPLSDSLMIACCLLRVNYRGYVSATVCFLCHISMSC